MDLTQLPLVVNHATTVHKLEGKTMERLVIAEWCAGKIRHAWQYHENGHWLDYKFPEEVANLQPDLNLEEM